MKLSLFRSLLILLTMGHFTIYANSFESKNGDTLKGGQDTALLSSFIPHNIDSLEISSEVYVPKHRKLKAVLLSILLGHFGVHRIYLGTKANVPVAYSLTLGGGLGLLPLIDTVLILQSKDLNEFSNNDRVIMWSKGKPTQP